MVHEEGKPLKLNHVGIDVSGKIFTVIMDHEGERTEAFDLPNDAMGHTKLIRMAWHRRGDIARDSVFHFHARVRARGSVMARQGACPPRAFLFDITLRLPHCSIRST